MSAMRMLMIVYDSIYADEVQELLDRQADLGFTRFERASGRGAATGNRLDNAVWPGFNQVVLSALDQAAQDRLLAELDRLPGRAGGIRVFAWPVEEIPPSA
jgi:hypothetical protein